MFSQFFGHYLLSKEKISKEQYNSCMKYIMANRVKLGLIAENENLLTKEQAEELNRMQMTTDKRFGDLAIEKGYLTDSDVRFLLSKQGSPYLIFIQALIENNCMTNEEISSNIEQYKKDENISDEIFNAIKDGNIEALLPAFIDSDNKKYLQLVGLALRNIIRFVNTYLRIEPGYVVTSHSPKYAAIQKTNGDYDGFLGFSCDDDSILTLAEGYAKESFNSVDEDALDSVAEFTNCINGLYAAELSYKDTSIDMLPPEFLFDKTIENIKGEPFYILPVYIQGKAVNLIVYIGRD